MPLVVTERWTSCARDEQSDRFALNGGRRHAARTLRSRAVGGLFGFAILRAHLPRRESDESGNRRGFGEDHDRSASHSWGYLWVFSTKSPRRAHLRIHR